MSLKQVFIILIGVLMGCGNSHDIQILVPGIIAGKLEVISLQTKQVIAEDLIRDASARLGAAELGLGFAPVEIRITNGIYVDFKQQEQNFVNGEFFSTVIGSGGVKNIININPLTTLSACRLQKTISTGATSQIDDQIEIENSLIAQQFKIVDLQKVIPDTNFSVLDVFNHESSYGILLGGFEQLAQDQQVRVAELVHLLCDDVSFEGVFNGIGRTGFIQSNHSEFDDQVLKARFASAIFDFSQKNVINFNKLPIGAFANEISMSKVGSLFSSGVVNYSFDH